MALENWYSTGTVSVENGSTTVAATGAFWGADAIMPGDLFCDPAQPLVPPQRVKEVTGNAELELWAPWPGSDIAAAPYEIRYVGIIERSTAQTRKVLEQLGDVKAWYDIIVEDDAARLALDTEGNPLRAGYRVLVKDDGVIWAKKTSAYGDWIGPVEFKGDKGDKGWSAVFGTIEDGERRVDQLVSWTGGEGAPPPGVGKYRGATGLVDDIEDATDVRGPAGDIDGVTPFWQGRITVDTTKEQARAGLGAGVVNALASGAGISVDNTDPANPVISAESDVTLSVLQSYWMPSNLELSEMSAAALLIGMDEGNGIFDGFNSLSMVDVANAVNLDTSEAGKLKPSQASSATVLDVLAQMNADGTGWVNYNVREFYRANVLANSGTQIRLTMTGASSAGPSLLVSGMTFGRRNTGGDPYDFAAAPAVVTVGGNAAFTVAAGSTVVSDWITFAFDETLDHVLAFHTTSGNMRRKEATSADSILYSKVGASEITVQNASGYTESSATSYGLVSKIESRVGDGVANLMVQSKDLILPEAPEWGRVYALISLNTAVVGTDLVFKIARNGTSFAAIEMVQKYSRVDGSSVLDSGVVDLSGLDPGASARWRIETANGKMPSILAIGVAFGVNA